MKVYKLLIIAVLTICFHQQSNAQTENQLLKRVDDQAEIYLKNFTIIEFRSRPLSVNKNVPPDELFENKEWILKRFVLTLKRLPSGEEETFWKYNVDLEREQEKFFNGVSIKDVALNGINGFVLYQAFNNLYVAHLVKDNSQWSEKNVAKLATSYETQPILEARFVGNKPEITAKYYTNNQKYGLWQWKLKDNKWKLVGNKPIESDSQK